MMKRTLVYALFGTLLTAGAVAGASAPVTLYVDGREIQTDVPAQIQNNRTLVPIRFVAEALGAPVYWSPHPEGGGRVDILSYPREFTPPPGVGTAMADRSRPSDLNALGAAAALTRFLADQQMVSAAQGEPVLVRFDLLDLRNLCRFPPPKDLKDFCTDGFRFAVRLYYVQLEDSAVSPVVAQYQRTTVNSETTIETVGKDVESAWYEDVTLDVRPQGPPEYGQIDDREVVMYGGNGWEVDVSSRSVLRKVPLDHTPYLIHGSFGR